MKNAKAKRRTTSQRLEVQWRKSSSTRRREILLPETPSSHLMRPIRSENRALLVTSIAKGRRWLNELKTEPMITVDAIAQRERCSVRKVNMTISLAFLAPNLVKAAIEGRLPYGMGVTRLCELPPEWPRQYRVLGLTTP
jgi:site-specific DNA recombinase